MQREFIYKILLQLLASLFVQHDAQRHSEQAKEVL